MKKNGLFAVILLVMALGMMVNSCVNNLNETKTEKTALSNAISKANSAKDGVVTSNDGTDVVTTVYWVTADQLTTLATAITAAQTVYDNENSDQMAVDNAKTVLEAATAAFNEYKQLGTQTGGQQNDVYNVYIAGMDVTGACYWENDTRIGLITTAEVVQITDITVSGSDVYVAGGEYIGGIFYPVYWKNGNKVALAGASGGWANAIAVSGSDVYVVGVSNLSGEEEIEALYWQNGVKTVLGTGDSRVWDVGVMGGDVYISGYYNNTPCYWKNGTRYNLNVPATADSTYTGKLAFSNGHFYIEGFYWIGSNKTFFYWTDGTTRVQLASPSNPSYIYTNGIAVDNDGDVYIIGYYGFEGESGKACYWRNGVKTDLIGGTEYTQTNDIAIVDNNVYIVGVLDNGGTFESGYWINGTKTAFYGGTDISANAITIVKK